MKEIYSVSESKILKLSWTYYFDFNSNDKSSRILFVSILALFYKYKKSSGSL